MTHKINVSVASLQPSQFEGWATKQGGSWKSWKRRWFVIKERKMWYFAGKTDNEAKGWIDLTPGTEVKDVSVPQKKKFMFSINSRGVKGEREFLIQVDNDNDLHGFLTAIKQVLNGDKKPPTSTPVNQTLVQPVSQPAPIQQPVNQPATQPAPLNADAFNQLPPNTSSNAFNQPPPVQPVAQPVVQQPVQQPTPVVGGGDEQSKVTFGPAPAMMGTQFIDNAKDMSEWLRNNQPEGVLDFLKIWTDSLPVPSEMNPGETTSLVLVASSDCKKLSWRVSGPQAAMIQKMVDFFWNVGAPEGEIDKLNDLGADLNPPLIGSWIDMSEEGGMDGGWLFPVTSDLITAKRAGDVAGSVNVVDTVIEWAQQHQISMTMSVGRDMGATPPRQTDFHFKIDGPNSTKAKTIEDAFTMFKFPPIPPGLKDTINNLPPQCSEVKLSVITSTDGFVRIAVIIMNPTPVVVTKVLDLCPSSNFTKHQQMLTSFGQPTAVEYAYLNNGFGFDVYKEGVDVHIHYNLGGASA
jgi:hypothetical protein